MTKLLGLVLVLMGMATSLTATAVTPEIDGSTAVSAVVLLAGATLVIRGRQKK